MTDDTGARKDGGATGDELYPTTDEVDAWVASVWELADATECRPIARLNAAQLAERRCTTDLDEPAKDVLDLVRVLDDRELPQFGLA